MIEGIPALVEQEQEGGGKGADVTAWRPKERDKKIICIAWVGNYSISLFTLLFLAPLWNTCQPRFKIFHLAGRFS